MRRRIVILYLVLAVIVSSLVAYVIYRYSFEMYIREIKTGLRNEAILINRIIDNRNRSEITDGFLKELSVILIPKDKKSEYNIASRRITLIDREGNVLADSDFNSKDMDNHKNRKEFIAALKNGIGVDVRKSETSGTSLFYLAYMSRELDALVRLSASVEHIDGIRNTILIYAVITILAGMVLSFLIALKMSNYVIKPIARLVREYGGNQQDNEDEEDEVGQLSSTLSSMTRRIESIIKELTDRNARVDTIINSLDDGLIAVDRSMNIIMINPIACKIFDVADKYEFIGTPLVQVIKNRQINDFLIKAIAGNKVIIDEICLLYSGKRYYSIRVSPIFPMDNQTANSGALAYINDITQVRKLEEMRSEFVSNVTHELKTPLTSIQGFVETLKTGAINNPDVAEKFLDIIDIETDRLRKLINDILELSEIESMNKDNERQMLSLNLLVQEIESILYNSLQEKRIEFENKVPPDVMLEANRHRIKQLLINLVDNAIKYNRPKGKIAVSTNITSGNLEIHVRDTGIGISQDHMVRIFERFYRVDKGRSREMGGTGLGLSIVKHITQLYGGSIRVESEEGKGSDFIAAFPLPKNMLQ